MLRIETLQTERHLHGTFDCGEPSLNRYLQENAARAVKSNLARVYVLCEEDARVLGYYSLSAATVLYDDVPAALTKKLLKYPQLPCILMGRLAVGRGEQGKQFGALLLADAYARAQQTAESIGVKLLIVDALHDKAAQFYVAYGFTPLPDQPLRLFRTL